MKVAFLVEHLDSRRGGMERSATEFLKEMVELGVDVHVVTQTISPEFSLAPAHVLGINGWSRTQRYHEFVTRADAFVARADWDIVHSVAPCLRCDLYQPRSGLMQEAMARTVAVRRNWVTKALRTFGAMLDSKCRLLTRLESGLLSSDPPPWFAALSKYMRRQLQEKYSLPERQIRVVFNGVTVDLPDPVERMRIRERTRQELNFTPQDLVAIFVGHNFRRKGLRRLMEALVDAKAERWKLLVLGKDSPRSYERYARHLGISRRIQFLGWRPDVHQLYLASDAGVLPTYYDPCARTVLEGLSLGLPYITTAFDGSSDCIVSGRQGYVIDSPESTQGIAEALHRLADGPARRAMSENALALRPYLSMRRHAQEIVRLYEEIAAIRSFNSRGGGLNEPAFPE